MRIVAASNGCLEEEVRAGRFRRDLFYRLNLLSIEVPPLRARRDDIPLLSQHFLRECARRYSSLEKTLHGDTMSWFNEYGWPGNIRELENLLHREYLLCEERELQIGEPKSFGEKQSPGSAALPDGLTTLAIKYRLAKAHALEQFDRAYLSQLLTITRGNITRAAALAGKERHALGKLLKHYGISHKQQCAEDQVS